MMYLRANYIPRIVVALMLLLPIVLYAKAPVIFQRDVITIIPHDYVAPAQVAPENTDAQNIKETEQASETEKKNDATDAQTNSDGQPPAISASRQPFDLRVEIRSEDALALEWIDSLNYLNGKNGVMVVLNYAGDVPVIQSPVYAALDLFCVQSNGAISRIYPELVLANLQSDISCGNDNKAYLYMQKGFATKHAITPKDRLDHPIFIRAPNVIK